MAGGPDERRQGRARRDGRRQDLRERDTEARGRRKQRGVADAGASQRKVDHRGPPVVQTGRALHHRRAVARKLVRDVGSRSPVVAVVRNALRDWRVRELDLVARDDRHAHRHLHAGDAGLRLRIDLHVVAQAQPDGEPRRRPESILHVHGRFVLPEALQERRLLRRVAVEAEVLRVEQRLPRDERLEAWETCRRRSAPGRTSCCAC